LKKVASVVAIRDFCQCRFEAERRQLFGRMRQQVDATAGPP